MGNPLLEEGEEEEGEQSSCGAGAVQDNTHTNVHDNKHTNEALLLIRTRNQLLSLIKYSNFLNYEC